MGFLSKTIKFKLAHTAFKKARDMFSEEDRPSNRSGEEPVDVQARPRPGSSADDRIRTEKRRE